MSQSILFRQIRPVLIAGTYFTTLNYANCETGLKLQKQNAFPELLTSWNDSQFDIPLYFTKDEITSDNTRARMEKMVRRTQMHYCHELEKLDGKAKFREDRWIRPKSGSASIYSGGVTRILSDGDAFEKAGVSVSISSGQLPRRAVEKMTANHGDLASLLQRSDLPQDKVEFFAASVSSVVHPKNPHAPTGHFNYRYFELGKTDEDGGFVPLVWWFGGGGDLTPSILYEEDCVHFHQMHKDACDTWSPETYGKFKKNCDEYFMIQHRGETRGVGGIFFDDLNYEGKKEELFAFVSKCAQAWSKSYVPIVRRRNNEIYTLAEKEWQQQRRGRYVEFNLVYDRGTSFGLRKPGARVESILMSMPLIARWEYSYEPTLKFELDLLEVLKNPRDWI